MILFLAALAVAVSPAPAQLSPIDPVLPAAWSQVVDISPSGLAADAARYCPGRVDLCPQSFQSARIRLAEAWDSSATSASDKLLMLATFRKNTTGGRVNWDFAVLNYFGARQTAMFETGQAVRPINRAASAAAAHRISGTMGCDTTVSRDRMHWRTKCWLDPPD